MTRPLRKFGFIKVFKHYGMAHIFAVESISHAHHLLGLPKPKHPLISIIKAEDLDTVPDLREIKFTLNYYQITLKSLTQGTLRYGKNAYDYEDGSLLFTAPGQVMEYGADNDPNNIGGWTLAFHADLIRKSALGDRINQYSFFQYDVNEALHLSAEEKTTIEGLLDKIKNEYSQRLDRHSQHLIVSTLTLLLDYCVRFYDRQFYTRTNINGDVVSKFERLLLDYFQSGKASELGLPSVSYCGQALNLSASYLSDLLKKETGKTTQEHIHLCVINHAKSVLLNSNESISKIGYDLGFEYPQHFSNLFKLKTGLSPRAYRKLN